MSVRLRPGEMPRQDPGSRHNPEWAVRGVRTRESSESVFCINFLNKGRSVYKNPAWLGLDTKYFIHRRIIGIFSNAVVLLMTALTYN